ALLDVLLPDRFGDVPLRVDGLAAHLELAARRPPVVTSEADGIRVHDRRVRVSGAVTIVEEPHLGNVHHDPLVSAARQHPRGAASLIVGTLLPSALPCDPWRIRYRASPWDTRSPRDSERHAERREPRADGVDVDVPITRTEANPSRVADRQRPTTSRFRTPSGTRQR